jgi:hypothetical protein
MELASIFGRTKVGRSMVVEADAQDLAARKDLEKRRAELLRDDARSAELARDERDADIRIIGLAAQIETAKAERQSIRAARQSRDAQRRGALSAVEAQLEAGAPSAIDRALELVDNAFERARRNTSVALRVQLPDGSMGYSQSAIDDVAETRARMGRIRAAREALRDLKLEALDAAELQARIAAIVESIDAAPAQPSAA